MKRLLKSKEGITLIALVITIIVLLILAGVTVATLTGENGLLSKAQLAKERSAEAEQDEKDKLSSYEQKIVNYESSIVGNRDYETEINSLKARIEKLENVEYGDFRKNSNQTIDTASDIITMQTKNTGNLILDENKVYLTEGNTYKINCSFALNTKENTYVWYGVYNKNNTIVTNNALAIATTCSFGHSACSATAIYTAQENDYLMVKVNDKGDSPTIVNSSYSLIVTEIN